jgi:hypothetical protein
MLTAANIDGGSGSIDITLPSSADGYKAKLDGGSGSLRVRVTDNLNLDLEIEGSSGPITIDLPANSAVRVEVLDDGSGSLSLPSRLLKIQSGDEKDEGVWQTEDFDKEIYKIIVRILDVGSGSITFR